MVFIRPYPQLESISEAQQNSEVFTPAEKLAHGHQKRNGHKGLHRGQWQISCWLSQSPDLTQVGVCPVFRATYTPQLLVD